MPNKETFTIKPIKELLSRYVGDGRGWIDPFARDSELTEFTNDLNPNSLAKEHKDAREYLKCISSNSMNGSLFDPPYSPRQVVECYDGFGKEVTAEETKMSFWSNCKNELARILKINGYAICCGWTSQGLGKNRGFEMLEILLVPHGGSKNDTIVTVERKIKEIL